MTLSRKERLQEIYNILKNYEREAMTSHDVYDLSGVVTRITSELRDLIDIMLEEE